MNEAILGRRRSEGHTIVPNHTTLTVFALSGEHEEDGQCYVVPMVLHIIAWDIHSDGSEDCADPITAAYPPPSLFFYFDPVKNTYYTEDALFPATRAEAIRELLEYANMKRRRDKQKPLRVRES